MRRLRLMFSPLFHRGGFTPRVAPGLSSACRAQDRRYELHDLRRATPGGEVTSPRPPRFRRSILTVVLCLAGVVSATVLRPAAFAQSSGGSTQGGGVKPMAALYVDHYSPTSGTYGTLVNIYGGYFGSTQGGGYVLFTGTSTHATIQYWSDAEVDANVPNGATSGPGSQPLLTISAHSPFGGLTSASLGNGLAESRNYTKRGWLGYIPVANGTVYSLVGYPVDSGNPNL